MLAILDICDFLSERDPNKPNVEQYCTSSVNNISNKNDLWAIMAQRSSVFGG